MSRFECAHEADVQTAVATGRWPHRADEALRAHVDGCAVCQDVVMVTTAFEDVDGAARPQPVPESAVVWWRSQMRARADAARVAARPITIAQALSFASIVGLLGAVIGATSPWLQQGVKWLAEIPSMLGVKTTALPSTVVTIAADHAVMIGAVGVCLLVMPLAVYFALRES